MSRSTLRWLGLPQAGNAGMDENRLAPRLQHKEKTLRWNVSAFAPDRLIDSRCRWFGRR